MYKKMSSSEATPTKSTPAYKDVGYFKLSEAFPVDAFNSALKYKARDDDLFIVTYPKCGTTWVQNIVALIYRHGKPFANFLEFLTSTPFLELGGAKLIENMKRPNAIKSHLPYHLAPYSPKAKYIFIARNPKDCCVSFYYHTKNAVFYKFEHGTFDDYFELFLEGEVEFGDYFDTLLSWYEHRDDENVLFLTYEGLKKDTQKYVLQIAEFMGEEYKEMMESDPKILKDVIHYSSITYMRDFMNQQMEEMAKLPAEMIENSSDIPDGLKKILREFGQGMFSGGKFDFIRKGIIGDWKNHFSEDQNRRLEAKFRERTQDTDIPNLWKDDM